MNDVEEDISLKERAFKICQDFLGEKWEDISLEDFQFDVITGGCSSKLYRCALPENIGSDDSKKVPREALFRIYGLIQDNPNYLLQELTTFIFLSERNLGPKLYGLFSNGRLEEYIPSRSLKWDELRILSTSIATEFAKIHALQLPISKKSVLQIHIYEWLEFAEKEAEKNVLNPVYDIISSGQLRGEVEWVINQTDKVNSPIVFCHNDLHHGNILLIDFPSADGQTIMFIDFEMAGYNNRGFDLANYFNERYINNNTMVNSDDFPTKCEKIEFMITYLNQLQKEGISFKNDLQTEANKLFKEISFFMLASNLYRITSIYRLEPISDLNQPFWKHASSRWEIYKKHKKKFLEECRMDE